MAYFGRELRFVFVFVLFLKFRVFSKIRLSSLFCIRDYTPYAQYFLDISLKVFASVCCKDCITKTNSHNNNNNNNNVHLSCAHHRPERSHDTY